MNTYLHPFCPFRPPHWRWRQSGDCIAGPVEYWRYVDDPIRQKRRPCSAEDRDRQRPNCLQSKPWRHASGPRTPEGKEQSRRNGYQHLPNPQSLRQLRRGVREETDAMISLMAELRAVFAREPIRWDLSRNFEAAMQP
jgi:hypothetical protein